MKDIANEHEERELKQDKAMKDLIADVIGFTEGNLVLGRPVQRFMRDTPRSSSGSRVRSLHFASFSISRGR